MAGRRARRLAPVATAGVYVSLHTCGTRVGLSRVHTMDDETRAYFEEMRRDLSGLRGEVTGLRGELSDFRGDVDRRFEALDDKIDSRAEEIRRDFGVLSEAPPP